MEEFRVPNRQVDVEILLQGGKELTGHMFVPEVGVDPRPEPLVNRLNDNQRFLPFAHDGSFEMVNKSRILLVRLPGPPPEREEPVTQEHHLSLELENGVVVQGQVRYLMPHERSRLIDFLNVAPRFIEIIGDGGRTLVNGDFVLRIRVLSLDPA